MNAPAFKNILTPIDLDDTSIAPLHYAGLFAHHFGAEVTLLYADEVASLFGGYDPEFLAYHMPATEDSQREQEALRNLAERHLRGVKVAGIEAVPGPPVTSIVRFAKEHGSDLIVMGTHGGGGWRRALTGSVADGVVRVAPVPVLVVPPRRDGRSHPGKISRVVCPVNFTETSRSALRYAASVAGVFNAELVLVHVHEYDAIDSEPVHDRLKSYVPADLRRHCAIRELVLRGGAAERVLDCIENERAELLVMGTELRALRTETVIGTTSERLLRFSSVPILSVAHKRVATEEKSRIAEAALA